jgi:predicted RNA-binding Zn-ribbon protein involved in translation (DUF1610 family)
MIEADDDMTGEVHDCPQCGQPLKMPRPFKTKKRVVRDRIGYGALFELVGLLILPLCLFSVAALIPAAMFFLVGWHVARRKRTLCADCGNDISEESTLCPVCGARYIAR